MAIFSSEKLIALRRELVDLPVFVKGVLTAALLIPATTLGLTFVVTAIEAEMVSSLVDTLPHLPNRGVELLEYFRIAQAKHAYAIWELRVLVAGSVLAGGLLFCLWWPRATAGITLKRDTKPGVWLQAKN